MTDITEQIDTFFNGRPAPRTAELEALRKQVEALVKRVQQLRAQLTQGRRWMQHIPGCPKHYEINNRDHKLLCTCGLNAFFDESL